MPHSFPEREFAEKGFSRVALEWFRTVDTVVAPETISLDVPELEALQHEFRLLRNELDQLRERVQSNEISLGLEKPLDFEENLITQNPLTRFEELIGTEKDFYTEVNKGVIPGHSLIHKFGSNLSVGTTQEDVWAPGGSLTFLTSADTLDVVSSSANDDVAGTHARTLTIIGLDDTFAEISETINLDGTVAVTTTASFRRVYRAYVVDVGTIGADGRAVSNEGNITITDTTGATTQAYIAAGDGQTAGTHYTIPAGKTAYLRRVGITIDTGKSANIHLTVREDADDVTVPVRVHKHVHHWEGLDSPVDTNFVANHVFNAKTDIWFEAVVTSGTAALDVNYDLLLVDN